MNINIDPSVGELLDRRYGYLANSLYNLALETEETLETDPGAESVTRLDLEYLTLFHFFPVAIKQDCPLDIILLLYLRLNTYLVIRGMYDEIVNWGVDLFE